MLVVGQWVTKGADSYFDVDTLQVSHRAALDRAKAVGSQVYCAEIGEPVDKWHLCWGEEEDDEPENA